MYIMATTLAGCNNYGGALRMCIAKHVMTSLVFDYTMDGRAV